MAEEGFKHKLAVILSTSVEGYIGDPNKGPVRTPIACRAAIADLALKRLRNSVDSPGFSILPNPFCTNGGNMRLDLADRRISVRCFLTRVLAVFWGIVFLAGCTSESKRPQYEIFAPAGGKGAVVLAVSGYAGTHYFRDFSSKLAELGYFTLLMDGKDLIDPGRLGQIIPGAENLQAAVAAAKSSPHAIPGKVALVGFSIGGAGVLRYGANLKDQVSAVVAFYPAISTTGWDMRTFAAGFQTPVLLLAGEQDHYENCCLIESMRELVEAPKTVPFEYVEYPNAGHCFNLDINIPLFTYRPQDAADSWARTVAFLDRLHPPGGK
jgi:dienelactone hydrolase